MSKVTIILEDIQVNGVNNLAISMEIEPDREQGFSAAHRIGITMKQALMEQAKAFHLCTQNEESKYEH